MSSIGLPTPEHKRSRTIDPKKVRLSVLALLVIASFVALYSRLWYLQVLAVDELNSVARNNRVRLVEYEPPRGRILDRWGRPLVENVRTLAVSLKRELVEGDPLRKSLILIRLATLLKVDLGDMWSRLRDATVSPYRPIPVAYDVPEAKAVFIEEHNQLFPPGVVIEKVWKRKVVRGTIAPHVLGYTNEIGPDELKDREWKGYNLGDIIGKAGVERSFDQFLRGEPRVERVVVDSAGDSISPPRAVKEEEAGSSVKLTIHPKIQRIVQSALGSGVQAARGAGYAGRSGAAVVLDPNNGDVLAMASYPSYDAKILANGYTDKDARLLGAATPNDPSDDALTNRPIQGPLPPGSTFKAITTAAALELDVVEPYEYVGCPGTFVPGDSGTPFYNWTSVDKPAMDIPTALEWSCNTVFFNLGWRMESRWGPVAGDGTLRFQRYARSMGFGHETGIELPYEHDGLVPDPTICDIKGLDYCPETGEYLAGYTVNMAVGQGDLLTTPLQMAVSYAAIANGGRVMEPRIVSELTQTISGKEETVKEFPPVVVEELGLDDTELSVIRQGLYAVVRGNSGTARDAFGGFGVPVAGKTGTAQVGESDASHAWFISYAPATDPQYVTAVYVEQAGHGGETAAPVAREIYEGIFNGDFNTSVSLGSDDSD